LPVYLNFAVKVRSEFFGSQLDPRLKLGRSESLGTSAGYGRTIEEVAKREKSPGSIAISEVREEVCRIASAHGASNVRVFGSTGRGEQGAASDLDLLVDMSEGRSLFDLIALSNDLEASLGVEVDVVTEASVSPYMRDRVLDEAVAL
jgi:predicted nucleotidyltransferase